MGIVYKKYLHGEKILGCNACKTHFATHDHIISRVNPHNSCCSLFTLYSKDIAHFPRYPYDWLTTLRWSLMEINQREKTDWWCPRGRKWGKLRAERNKRLVVEVSHVYILSASTSLPDSPQSLNMDDIRGAEGYKEEREREREEKGGDRRVTPCDETCKLSTRTYSHEKGSGWKNKQEQ